MTSSFDITKFEYLKASGDLPSPKGVALAVMRALQHDDCSTGELARIIKTDPAFVGRIVKAANGVAGFNRRAVASVQDAILVLGMRAVRTLALGFSLLSEYRNGVSREFDYPRYWSGCLAQALAMQAIAHHTRAGALEDMFCLGLLARVGELALATLYPAEYDTLQRRRRAEPATAIARLEHELFAISHGELGGAMLADWGLPKVFCVAAEFAEHPERAGHEPGSRSDVLTRSLQMAACMAALFVAPETERAQYLPRLIELGGTLDLPPALVGEISDGVAREWQAWGPLLDVETPDIPSFEVLAAQAADMRAREIEMAAAPDATETIVLHEAQPGASRPLGVLVVHDDAETRSLIRRVLEVAGHDVREAREGRRALECVLESPPQLLIVDRDLADGDGLEFVRNLRQTKIGRGLYVLMLMRAGDDDRLIEAFENGADDFVHTPVSPKILAARLRAAQRVINLQEELERDREEVRRFAAELAVSNRRFQEMALTDSLTGFPNRRYAMERVAQEWSTASRTRRPLSAMVVDVDEFKRFNDNFGHDTGDTILRQVANSLKTALRAQDVVARTGGDEFLVICPDTHLDAALACAERVRFAVEAGGHASAGGRVTVSIGVATREAGMNDAEALVKRADQALYQAKNKGRNRITTTQTARPAPLVPPRGTH